MTQTWVIKTLLLSHLQADVKDGIQVSLAQTAILMTVQEATATEALVLSLENSETTKWRNTGRKRREDRVKSMSDMSVDETWQRRGTVTRDVLWSLINFRSLIQLRYTTLTRNQSLKPSLYSRSSRGIGQYLARAQCLKEAWTVLSTIF